LSRAKNHAGKFNRKAFFTGQSIPTSADCPLPAQPKNRNIAMTFANGELVGVPCSIQRGPFPDEHLVMVETDDGTIWGFVQQSNLQMGDGTGNDMSRGYIKSAVVEDARESILVRMFGSFFTTALGLASVKRNCLTRLAAQ
jgi:hypothetical protein